MIDKPTSSPFAVPEEQEIPEARLAVRRSHLLDEIRSESRSRRLRPSLVGAIVLVAFVAIAAPAFGLTSRISGLFEGAPAMPPEAQRFVVDNEVAQAQENQLPSSARHSPFVDVSTAHGVLSVPSASGTLQLWAANQASGKGVCWFVAWLSDENAAASASTVPPGGVTGGGSCSQPTPPGSGMEWGYGWGEDHLSEDHISGYVYPDATSVQVTLGDGTVDTLPVVEHFFLGTFPRGSTVTHIDALDSAGAVVASDNPGA